MMVRGCRRAAARGVRMGLAAASLLWAALLASEPAAAREERLALVVGNGRYAVDDWTLDNPVNDARDVHNLLEDTLRFDSRLVLNADEDTLEDAITRFGNRLRRAGSDAVGLFYYAGHGVQHDGRNYLVPVDADAVTADVMRAQSAPLGLLLDDMGRAGNAVNIVVLDACRDMPLPNSNRDVGGPGLAELDTQASVFIGYATSPGRTARDGAGRNSPYTQALLEALRTSAHEPLALVFDDVSAAVRTRTRGGQRPEYRNGITVNRYALAGGRGAKRTRNAPDPVEPETGRRRSAGPTRVSRDAPGAFPLSALHPEVRRAVIDARDAEQRAERAADRAYAAERAAEDAAARARAGEAGHRGYDYPNDERKRRYEGGWSDTTRNGHGTLTVGAGPFEGDRYAGEWRDGRFQGVGVYRHAENANATNRSLRYAGDYANDKANGAGVFLWRDGDRHAGGERDGNKSGPGVFRFADGRRYEGEYANDERNGYGVLWNADGTVNSQGVWTDGTFTTPLRP